MPHQYQIIRPFVRSNQRGQLFHMVNRIKLGFHRIGQAERFGSLPAAQCLRSPHFYLAVQIRPQPPGSRLSLSQAFVGEAAFQIGYAIFSFGVPP